MQVSYQKNGTSYLSSISIHRLLLPFSCLLLEQLHLECLNISRMRISLSRNSLWKRWIILKTWSPTGKKLWVIVMVVAILLWLQFHENERIWKRWQESCDNSGNTQFGSLATTSNAIIMSINWDFWKGFIPCCNLITLFCS